MAITFEYVQSIISDKTQESRTLEFKQTLPGRDKAEFLKDVSAIANTAGGTILYGIMEARQGNEKLGYASGITNIRSSDIAAEKGTLQNWLSSGVVPRIPGITIEEVKSSPDSEFGILVITLPPSWIAPHMVKDGNKLYVRTNTGCEPMDIDQIRSLCLTSEGIESKVRSFHNGRLSKIIAGETPIAIDNSAPILVLHFIPLEAMSANPMRITFNDRDIRQLLTPPSVEGSVLHPGRFNVEGFLTFDRYGAERLPHTYLQAYKSGILEGIAGIYLEEGGEINQFGIEEAIKRTICNAFDFFLAVGINPPVLCLPTVLRCKGRKIVKPSQSFGYDSREPIDRNLLFLPEIQFEDFDKKQVICEAGKCPPMLKDSIDTLWQACSLPERICPHHIRK